MGHTKSIHFFWNFGILSLNADEIISRFISLLRKALESDIPGEISPPWVVKLHNPGCRANRAVVEHTDCGHTDCGLLSARSTMTLFSPSTPILTSHALLTRKNRDRDIFRFSFKTLRSRARPPAYVIWCDVFPRPFVTETPRNRVRDTGRVYSKR